uniref:Zinc finger, GRF-type n=1 Tax=Tanacetum cinerariifolium TaxID=118510 RepID=A0A699GN00_TANCI|nr:zinc finger, GRF-type [Tanacetum cinerariifolium]
MIVLHLWYDPPVCQRSVQIIPGLLRSRNELEEIIAMVEEKRRKLLKFLIISWVMGYVIGCGFVLVDGMNMFGSHGFDHLEELMQTQREAQQAVELSNLTRQRQLLASVNYRRAIIEELERLLENLVALRQLLDIIDERRSFIRELEQRLPINVMAYKTRQELKGLKKDDMIRAMKMRSKTLQLHHQAMKGFHFYKSL